MNNKIKKVTTSMIVGAMIFTNTAFAATNVINKSETVYVIKEDDEIKDTTVSVWLNSDENIKAEEKTDLKDIKNLSTDEKIQSTKGYVKWDEDKKDIFYQGKSDKTLPVDVKVEYYLDGIKTGAKDLEGKSGHLEIHISALNNQFTTKKINGKDTKIYSPFTAVSVMSFKDDNVKSIKAEDSKVVKDGRKEVVTTVLTPGLRENFEGVLKDAQMENFKSEAYLEMEITDYEPAEVYVVISNELFQNNFDLGEIGKLRDGVKALEDNSQKLVDASEKLSAGQKEINKGIGEMGSGVAKLHDGSEELYNKSGRLEEKFDEVIEKVKPIPKYVAQMDDGGTDLKEGIEKYTGAVGEINDNTGKMKDGARRLAEGSDQLDEGIGQLKNATMKLRQGSEKLGKIDELKSQLTRELSQLQRGFALLGNGASELNSGIDTAIGSADKIAQGNNAFNEKLQEANSEVQKINIQGLSNIPNLDITQDLTNIGAQVGTIGNQLENIKSAIAVLTPLLNSEDPNVQMAAGQAIEILSNSAASIGDSANFIGSSAGNMGSTLSALNGLKDSLAGLENIQQLQMGMAQLANSSNEINVGIQQLPGGLSELKGGAVRLEEGIKQLDTAFSQGTEQISGQMDLSEIKELSGALTKLDDAAGQLKEGSSKLKAGTEESEAGVDKLVSALAELDSNSSKLNEGANELSSGLHEFRDKSEMIRDIPKMKTEGITPLRAGILKLNNGIGDLDEGTSKLKNGSNEMFDAMDTFSDKLKEFKQKGIDELDNKTKELPEFQEIVDAMSELSERESSFTGESDGFKCKYRIIEKIK